MAEHFCQARQASWLAQKEHAFLSNVLVQGDKPSAPNPDSKVGNSARRDYSEQALYRQMSHFRRQLDAGRALGKFSDPVKRDEAATRLAPVRSAVDAGVAAVVKMQERNAYHWVDLRRICEV